MPVEPGGKSAAIDCEMVMAVIAIIMRKPGPQTEVWGIRMTQAGIQMSMELSEPVAANNKRSGQNRQGGRIDPALRHPQNEERYVIL